MRKGGSRTDKLVNNLMEAMESRTIFELPVLGGISESVVVTWLIMAALLVFCLVFVRGLKVENPGRFQIALESGVGWLQDFFGDLVGREYPGYMAYLSSVLIYLAISNTIGIFGFKPPTKDMNVTIALAVMSMLLIEGAGIRKNGVLGWLKHFAEPVPIVAPIMIMEVVIRPLSLCMRLFGNILAGVILIELIKTFVPLLVPVPLNFYFDIFDGLLQAYVFVFLTGLFVKEEME